MAQLRNGHAGHIGLVGLTQYLCDDTFANLSAVVVDKQHIGTLFHLVLYG